MFGAKKKYKVDYNGQKDFFKGAKELYKSGEEVRVCYNMIATDTDYSFFVDGEPFSPDFNGEEGYIIQFTMPEHDVSIEIKSKNSMICVKDIKKEEVLTFNSFDGGGPSYDVKIEDKSIVSCNQTHYYFNPDHDMMCGSGYEVSISFTGLKPGKTTATIECRSIIADNYDAIYDITVDDDLGIELTEREIKNLIRP